MSFIPRPANRRAYLPAVLVVAVLMTSCGGDDDDAGATTTSTASAAGNDATTTVVDVEPEDDDLETAVTEILEAAMEAGAIDWSRSGVQAPPTAVTAGVRMDGRDDVLVVVGEQVDGSPATATDPVPVSSLTGALSRTIALQLVDEGLLDPSATVDAWAPDMPGAAATTVQAVIEMRTGWSRWGAPGDDVVLDDLERVWTLSEVVALVSPSVTLDPDPSVVTTDLLMNDLVLGHVLEQVTGESLGALVESRIAGPLGLSGTEISDGSTHADGYRHGVFDLDGMIVDTSLFPTTAFFTWHTATFAAVSTVPDLLDLLDAWHAGALFTADRTPGPGRFGSDRATSVGDPASYDGLGVPFNGYCPCTVSGDGHEVAAIGRTPAGRVVGSDAYIFRYEDGISVVVQFNSEQAVDRAQTRAVADAIHAAATAAS
jgi:CubicO group peptidase (beta-lactamase class C family)